MLFGRQFYKFVLHTPLRAVCEKNGVTSYIILEYTGECDIVISRYGVITLESPAALPTYIPLAC